MAEIVTDRNEKTISARWAVPALVLLLTLTAIYAFSTSSKTYVKPMDKQNLPKAPELLERGLSGSLHTQSSQNQPVGSNYSAQLQTGSSSVQQASPNSPQHAGASSPSDLMYTAP